MRKTAFLLALFWVGCLWGFAESIKNVSSEEAFAMVKKPDTFLIDVRSVAEYVFVGHPAMAYNIPLMFWNETRAKMENNSAFPQDLQDRFQKNDRLIFI
jgi:rhodanese-related sulfurtransferase